MQETEKSSSNSPLTVEQLLQLKRLEKPTAEFWSGFERELQQKQLQALMRPSPWAKIRAALSAVPAHLAPVSAAAALCITAGLVAFSFFTAEDRAVEFAAIEARHAPEESLVLADALALEGEAAEEPVVFVPHTDFVVDAIVPEGSNAAPASFKTYYVVEAFHIGGPQPLGFRGGAFEF
jgi:hypothetical protein